MIAYQKLRVTVASNGAFKCNAILIKEPSGAFMLVTDQSLPGLCDDNSSVISFTNRLYIKNGGEALYSNRYRLEGLFPTDGFMTAALRIGEESIYRFEPIGACAVVADGDTPEIDMKQMFAEEASQNAISTGITFKDGYQRGITYQGVAGYHHHQQRNRFNLPLADDKPWRIGVELEVYARTPEDYNTIAAARSNWFLCETDGSLRESINGVSGLGIELKTIPLKACDAKSVDFWQEPMARLAQLAKSKRNDSTGLHVHIGKEILGNNDRERQRTLDKLTWFYYYLVEDVPANHAKNVVICGRERGYSTRQDAGKTELADFAKAVGFDAVAKSPAAFDKMACTVKEKIRGQRDDINLGNLDTYGTIEFRKGKGCIGKTRMAAIVTWWEQMCLYCRDTAPTEMSFDGFFQKVTREYPAVAYFFQQDEEA